MSDAPAIPTKPYGFWKFLRDVVTGLISLASFAVFVQSCTSCRPLYPVEARR